MFLTKCKGTNFYSEEAESKASLLNRKKKKRTTDKLTCFSKPDLTKDRREEGVTAFAGKGQGRLRKKSDGRREA